MKKGTSTTGCPENDCFGGNPLSLLDIQGTKQTEDQKYAAALGSEVLQPNESQLLRLDFSPEDFSLFSSERRCLGSLSLCAARGGRGMWLWVKTVLVPFWGECTTHFRTHLSGDWDVHWGYGILTHGHVDPYECQLQCIN